MRSLGQETANLGSYVDTFPTYYWFGQQNANFGMAVLMAYFSQYIAKYDGVQFVDKTPT